MAATPLLPPFWGIMIVYKKGDLLKSGAHVIVHGCNCYNVMGAGVAQMIKHRWPAALEADRLFSGRYQGPHLDTTFEMLGLYSQSGKATPEEPLIINLYTQHGYSTGRRRLNYEALMLGMTALSKRVHPDWRVAMPKIGAGLAGGDWDIIELMINKAFGDREVEVWLYDPAAN